MSVAYCQIVRVLWTSGNIPGHTETLIMTNNTGLYHHGKWICLLNSLINDYLNVKFCVEYNVASNNCQVHQHYWALSLSIALID